MSLCIYDLPTEILAEIVTRDFATFKAALLAPKIGPRMCSRYIQNIARGKFLRVEDTNCYIKYYLDGKLHNTKGPAVIYKDVYMCVSVGRCYKTYVQRKIVPKIRSEYWKYGVFIYATTPTKIRIDAAECAKN